MTVVLTAAKVRLQRRLLLIAGCVYFAWWLTVSALLPGAYNAALGRLLVVFAFLAAFAASYASQWVEQRLETVFAACAWSLTFHYYYLLHRNQGETAWAIGAYIVVFAVAACLPSRGSLLAYSIFTLLLGAAVAVIDRALLHTIFLPGLATMTLLSNLTLHNRLLLERERADRDRSETARLVAEAGVALRDEFISTASHELRTPLTSLQLSVQGLLRLLRRGDARPADFERPLAVCERQALRLTALVERLLDGSRMASRAVELTREPIALVELLRDVARMLAPEAERAGSVVEVGGDEALEGSWDRIRLEQIVSNLLRNAILYGRGRPISISAVREGSEARVSVRDQGIGIALEERERIFGRFERAVPSRNYGGMGLGLYIARQLADAHGGRVTVESTPGEGSTFTVHLPLTARETS